MVPLDGNGCPGCKIVCMGGLSIGFGADGQSSELLELANGWVDGPELAQTLQKVNVCKYPPIGRMEILSMAGLCL